MRFNVAQLLKESIGSTRSYGIDEIVTIPDVGTQPVRGQVRLVRTDRGILAQAGLELAVEIRCSRCLSLFGFPVYLRIEEVYFPTVDIHSGRYLPLPDEPGAFTIDENHILDLSETLRQYVLLAMPMKPLCRSDCAGLCTQCGQNLNVSPCQCPSQPHDPRWALLEKLA